MRFSRDFRAGFANRVARHFDKYCEITNPVEFDLLLDVYKEAFTTPEWNAMNLLLGTSIGRECLSTGYSFDLYLPSHVPDEKLSRWQQRKMRFVFADEKERPDLEIEYDKLSPKSRNKIGAWVKKAMALKDLRGNLWQRCDSLLDWGWEVNRYYTNSGWRGGPTKGQGCNTPGQVYRIWPELLAFLDGASRDQVRGSSVKSKLPDTIIEYGTPAQFRCIVKKAILQTDAELSFERRKFDALTHILVQMSLMMEVKHIKDYPHIS